MQIDELPIHVVTCDRTECMVAASVVMLDRDPEQVDFVLVH